MGVHHAWGRSLKDMYQRYHPITQAESTAQSAARRKLERAPCRLARSFQCRKSRISRLSLQAEDSFDFNFHPKSLAVEAVLIPHDSPFMA